MQEYRDKAGWRLQNEANKSINQLTAGWSSDSCAAAFSAASRSLASFSRAAFAIEACARSTSHTNTCENKDRAYKDVRGVGMRKRNEESSAERSENPRID